MSFEAAGNTKQQLHTVPHLSVFMRYTACLLLMLAYSGLLGQDYQAQTGSPAFSIAQPVPHGFVNLANGNLHVEIPLASAPQRGSISFAVKLIYDSRIWQVVNVGGNLLWKPTNIPNSWGGWRIASSADPGTVTSDQQFTSCDGSHFILNLSNFVWQSPDGTKRKFAINTAQDQGGCGGDTPTGDAFAMDASGYRMYVTNYDTASVYAKDGTRVFPSVQDTNGNHFSADTNGNIVDTLGRTVVQKSVSGNQIILDVLNSQGTTSRITISTKSIAVHTHFIGELPAVPDDAENITVLDRVQLPTGEAYTFAYDEAVTIDPQSGAYQPGYGLLTGVSPGGPYNYQNFVDAFGIVNRWATNTADATISYVATPPPVQGADPGSSATLTRNGASLTYLFLLKGGAWNTEISSSPGSDNHIVNTYDFSHTACSGCPPIVTLTSTTETKNTSGGAITKRTEYTYDSPQLANVTLIKSWNYYPGSFNATPPALPDHQTSITYVPSFGQNISDRVDTITSKDGAGNAVAQTKYLYDSLPLATVAQPIVNNDSSVGTSRGNLTQISNWIGGTSFLTSLRTYDTTGQPVRIQDPAGNPTTLDYSDNFFNDNGTSQLPVVTSPQATNAFPTTITPPLGIVRAGYYYGTGKQAFSTDQNNQKTFHHYVDPMDRLTQEIGPKGWSALTYSSLFAHDIFTGLTDTLPSTNCTGCVHTSNTLDLQGHVTSSTLMSDPDGAVSSTATYDINGNLLTSSNPSRNGTGGSAVNSYDILYRLVQHQNPDNSVAQVLYGNVGSQGAQNQLCPTATYGTGFPIFSIDEVGIKHQVWKNAFGNVIEADEADASNALTVATCYQYDAAGRLIQAVQGGLSRAYEYDRLGRATKVTTPEAGVEVYSYVNDDGTLCSGNPSNVCKRTDARAIVTRYQYDVVGRLTQKTYSDGTPTAFFKYDETSALGAALTNTASRASSMFTQDGTGRTLTGEIFSYDAAGSVITNSQCTPQNCGTGLFQNSYTTDQMGNIVAFNNNWGRSITSVLNNAGQVTSVSLSGPDATHPATIFSNARYNAFGEMTVATLGNGLTEAMDYSGARGWLESMRVGSLAAANPNGSNAASPGQGTVTIQGILRQATGATSGTATLTIAGGERSISNGTGTPGTGTLTINGQEQLKQVMEIPAVGGTGTVTINGSVQSKQVPVAASSGAGSIVISGVLQTITASTWANQDLTSLVGSDLAGSSGGMAGFMNSGGCPHVAYVASNQHIIDIFLANVSGGCSATWTKQDLTALTDNTLAAAGSPIRIVGAGGGASAHLFYIGTDRHINRIYWPTAGGVLNQDLTNASGSSGTPAGPGSGIAAIINAGGCPHLSYIDTNQHLSDLFMTNITGGCTSTWSRNDMTALTGNTSQALAGSPVVSMKAAGDGLAHLFYIGSNHHVYRIYWNLSGVVLNQDLGALVGNSTASTGTGLEGIVNNGGCPHVQYVASNQHVYDLYLPNVTGGCSTTWNQGDLTSTTGNTLLPAAASPFTDVGTAGDGLQHIFYIGSTGHIDRLFWNNSGVLQNQDLTAITGNTAIATGSPLGSAAGGAENAVHVFAIGANQHIYHLSVRPGDVNDSGTVTINITGSPFGSFAASAPYSFGSNNTSALVSSALLNDPQTGLNRSGSPVHATLSGTLINLTALQNGTISNYGLSSTSAYDAAHFSAASFTAAPLTPTMTGGAAATTQTLYDSGTVKVTVGSYTATVPYGQVQVPGAISWGGEDVTIVSGGAQLAFAGPLGFAGDAVSPQHVFFIDANKHIHEQWLDSGGKWHDQDITLASGSPVTNTCGVLTSFALPGSSSLEHVFFVDANQHVREQYTNAIGQWQNRDITVASNAGTTPSGCGVSGFSTPNSNSLEHLVYVDGNGHVHELWTDSAGNWHERDNTNVYGTPALAQSSKPAFFPGNASLPEHLLYVDVNNHLREQYSDANGLWHDQDLTALAGGSIFPGRSPAPYVDSSGSEHIFYVGADSDIHHTWNDAAGWHDEDALALEGHSSIFGGASVSQLVAFQGSNGSKHLFYDAASTIYHLWNDSDGWHQETLPLQAAFVTAFFDGANPQVFIATTDMVHLNKSQAAPTYQLVNSTADQVVSTLLNDLNTGLNVAASPVNASLLSGTTLTLRARQGGQASNLAQSISSVYDTSNFPTSSFSGSLSGPTLTGGMDGFSTPLYDSGTLSVAINNHVNLITWGEGDTPQSMASALASDINHDPGAAVIANAQGNVVTFTARVPGANTNYTYVPSIVHNLVDFPQPSFTFQPSATPAPTLQGGSGGIFDTGTITVTVNGHSTTYNYGQTDTFLSDNTGIYIRLAKAINSDPNSPVFACCNNSSVLTLTAKKAGTAGNYPISVTSTTNNSNFTGTSFPVTVSGATLSGGGQNSGASFYDSGVATLSIGSLAVSTGYNSNSAFDVGCCGIPAPGPRPSTAFGIATALVQAINQAPNAPVIAAVSSSPNSLTVAQISLIAKNGGSATNYTLTSSLVSNDPAHFPSASFAVSPTSSALTGGSNQPNAQAGSSSIATLAFGTSSTFPPTSLSGCPGQVDVTINGVLHVACPNSATPTSVAAAVAQGIDTTSNSPVTATASGSNVVIQSVSGGANTSYPISVSIFGIPATVVTSGPNLAGGTDGAAGGSTGFVYALDVGTDPSGTVFSANDSVNGNWAYFYDNLNRLAQASTATMGYTYDYDRYGNRLHQTPSNGGGNSLSLVYANNRIVATGVTYDLSGNMTSDGTHTYAYDAENRLISVDGGQTATYVYSADGRRIRATVGSVSTDFIYDLTGQAVGIMAANGTLIRQEIGGLATYSDDAYFHHRDWLGNMRATTDHTGTIRQTCTNLPYGDGLTCTPTGITPTDFTGYMRDSETNLDFANARYYTSQYGRFMSVDPVGGSLSNPQSLNPYAYVGNGPLSATDPSGMSPDDCPGDWCGPNYIGINLFSNARTYAQVPWAGFGNWSLGPFTFSGVSLGSAGLSSIGGIPGGNRLMCLWFSGCGPGSGDVPPPKPSNAQLEAERASSGPSFFEALKANQQCAQDRANLMSVASLTGTQDSFLGSMIGSNDFASISGIIFGSSNPDPPGTPPLGTSRAWNTLGVLTSNPTSARWSSDAITIAGNAIGATAPGFLGQTRYLIGENGAGTAYVRGTYKVARPWVRTLGKIVSRAFLVKSIYDGLVYTGAMVNCAAGAWGLWQK